MLVTWKYRKRDTFIQRLDPRTRLIFMACVIFGLSFAEIWDFRLIFPIFLLVLTLYFLARIEWKDIKRTWIFIIILVVFIVGLNGMLSGRGGPSQVFREYSPVLFKFPFPAWGVDVTVAKAWFAITQMTRMLTMAILAIPLPYTMDPNIYGVTFRRMGVSDKISFTMDLAFRFLPTFARDFTITVDAQRARGYEMETLKGGIISRLRKLAPLIVPVTMQSTVTGEEVIDAMDLRAFGTLPRTWLKQLHYERRDFVMIAVGVLLFVTCLIFRFGFGFGDLWIPGFMYNLVP
jgi:energy-coupling factor transport system permease protein